MTNKKERGLWNMVVICLLAVFFLFYLCLKFIPFGQKGEVIGDMFSKAFVRTQVIPVTWFPYPFFDSSHTSLLGEKYGYGIVEGISYSSNLQKGTIVIRKGFGKRLTLVAPKTLVVVTPAKFPGYFIFRSQGGKTITDEQGKAAEVKGFRVDLSLLSKNDYVKYIYNESNEIQEIEWIGSANNLFF